MSYDAVQRYFQLSALNPNQTNTDIGSVLVLPPRFRVMAMRLSGATASLGASLGTLSLRDAAAGAGNLIVTGATMTALTSSVKVLDMTIAITDVITTSGLYIRSLVTTGVVGTVDITLEILVVP